MINDPNNSNNVLPPIDDQDSSIAVETEEKSPPIPREDLAKKLERARLSMEGPERTLRRERSETENKVETERLNLENKLKIIAQDKEKYEINWVVLDNKLKELRQLLDPIKADEEKIELEEERLESQEHTTADVLERQEIEKKRWAIQDKRKTIEKQKWILEDKIIVTTGELEKNTLEYQKLLDEEENIHRKIDNLEYELDVVEEQIKLQQEAMARKEAEVAIVSEKARRQALDIQKQTETNNANKPDLKIDTNSNTNTPPANTLHQTTVASAVTPEITKPVTEKVVEFKPQTTAISDLEADQKERAALEIKRQEAMAKIVTADTPKPAEPELTPKITLNDKPQSIINDITAQRNTILESARLKAEAYEAKNKNDSIGKTSPNIIDLSQPTKTSTIEIDQKSETPIKTVPNNTNASDTQTSNNVLKLRTFKTDVDSNADMTDLQKAEARKKFPWLK